MHTDIVPCWLSLSLGFRQNTLLASRKTEQIGACSFVDCYLPNSNASWLFVRILNWWLSDLDRTKTWRLPFSVTIVLGLLCKPKHGLSSKNVYRRPRAVSTLPVWISIYHWFGCWNLQLPNLSRVPHKHKIQPGSFPKRYIYSATWHQLH
jgi:hypothetical protein